MQGRANAIVVKIKTKKNGEEEKTEDRIIVQTPLPPFTCLALEGGGVACAGHAGAINVLEKYGLLNDVKHVSGISGGAIAAAAICLGYSGEQVTSILSNLPMEKFMEQSDSWYYTPTVFSAIRKGISILRSPHFALSTGDVFLAWLKHMVKEKLGDENATFADLDRKIAEEMAQFGETKLKHLYIGGTRVSLNFSEVETFSAETEPDMPIALAMRISAAYPGIFAPVMWKGRMYGDGGIKAVLQTKIFDKKKYLPEGYDFNENGLNPAVLAVKVDTYEEIMQIIWGVKNEIEIVKASQYLWQVGNAAAHNTDIDEIRQGRTVIPLADADVDRLDLNLSPKMKLRLVDEAEKTTYSFLQDYINASYKTNVYSSGREWLQAQTDETIKKIRTSYQELYRQLEANQEEAKARDLLANFDPSRPTLNQLHEMIDFLSKYLQLSDEERQAEQLQFPDRHINIKPNFSEKSWHAKVKADMQARLDVLNAKMDSATSEYLNLLSDLTDCLQAYSVQDHSSGRVDPFHGHNDEKVQVIASYHEYLNKIREERDDLEVRLGINCRHQSPDAENSRQYAVLSARLREMVKDVNLSSPLRAVLLPTLPIISFEERAVCDIDFQLDMRNGQDRKIYLIAAMMYVEKAGPADKTKFLDIFQEFFPGKKSPVSAAELVELIGLDGAILQISMFRLERLLHYFEKKERPGIKPTFDLDVMLGVSKHSIFANKKKPEDGAIEMRLVFKSPDLDKEEDSLPLLMKTSSSSDEEICDDASIKKVM